jgi:hypothetical protein
MQREIVIRDNEVIINDTRDMIVTLGGIAIKPVREGEIISPIGIASGPEVIALYEKLRRDPNRFEKQKDGWFRDNFTGKYISPPSFYKHLNWDNGKEYADELGGQFEIWNWDTFIDRTRKNPAIVKCAEVLELKTDDWHWSQTPYSSAVAWFVHFDGGSVSNDGKDGGGYVRPVRSQ